MNALVVFATVVTGGFFQTPQKPFKPTPVVPTKVYITYYIDLKGDPIKPWKKATITDKATIKKLQKMFQESFDRTPGSNPAGWKAGTWIRFEDDKHRSREAGMNYKGDRWSWGKGDFAATAEMRKAVWNHFAKAKPVKESQP